VFEEARMDAGVPHDQRVAVEQAFGGHWVNWIQYFNRSGNQGRQSQSLCLWTTMEWCSLEGDGLSLERWNHRPAVMRAALRRSTR
jgi:hypothetical protein